MASNDFDPFGWDDDVSFDPEEFEDGETGEGNIDDIQDLWDLAMDYDFDDLYSYEFEGTGDTG